LGWEESLKLVEADLVCAQPGWVILALSIHLTGMLKQVVVWGVLDTLTSSANCPWNDLVKVVIWTFS